jgi:NADH-quinone oxidoreductase subunit H
VAGFHTEYSGLRWSFFFMAEYGSMLTVSLLAAILFLGGWHGPIPLTSLLGLQPSWLQPDGWLAGTAGDGVAHIVCQVLGVINVIGKGCIGVCIMMWIRWTLPRLRIDQVMTTCLKYCTPIAAAMFLGAALWHVWLPEKNFFGLTHAPVATYQLTEGWLAEATDDADAEEPADAAPETDAVDAAADQTVMVASPLSRRAN